MTTAVGICSNASLRLGGKTISSFDEADPFGSNLDLARLASNLWPTVRKQVMRLHPWNCAVKRVLLSPDAEAPAFGKGSRFQLPGDWLRTVEVTSGGYGGEPFATEGGYLVSRSATLELTYVFDNENPATYDAGLVGALETAMAAAMAYPITGSTSLAAELKAELDMQLRSARVLDAQDDSPQTLGDYPLMASRYGGRSWG